MSDEIRESSMPSFRCPRCGGKETGPQEAHFIPGIPLRNIIRNGMLTTLRLGMYSKALFLYNRAMIYLGSDHAGFQLKEEVKKFLQEQQVEVEDMGAFALNPEDDYPDFIIPVAKKVSLRQVQGEQDVFGIIFGATGQGEAMTANKIKGIRAALYYGGSLEIVKRSRSHNNANILSLGARFLTKEEAFDAITLWLHTEFEGGRHERRLEKIQPLGT